MSASSTHIYLLSILTTMKRIEQSGESTMTHNGQLMPSHICRNFNNNFISSWKPPRAKSYHIRQSAIHWHHHFTNLTFLWAHKQPNKTQRLASATYRHHLYRLYCIVCIYYMKWSTSWRSSWALYTICIYIILRILRTNWLRMRPPRSSLDTQSYRRLITRWHLNFQHRWGPAWSLRLCGGQSTQATVAK